MNQSAATGSREPRWSAPWALGVALAVVALAIRLFHLSARTITHPEVFVPGIDLPPWSTIPGARHTLYQVLRGTLEGDIHPPLYYVAMLGWTKALGVSLWGIRFPAALFGAAVVGITYATARRVEGWRVALAASALLAFGAGQIWWSQSARMWTMTSAIIVASVFLLQSLSQRWSNRDAWLYALVLAAGLWTEWHFWPVYAAQVAWIFVRTLSPGPLPKMLWAPAVALVGATPLIGFLRWQLGAPIPVDRATVSRLGEMAQFGQVADVSRLGGWPGTLIAIALALVGIAAFVAGARQRPVSQPATDDGPWRAQHWLALGAVALGATAISAVLFTADIANRWRSLLLALPWVFLGVIALLHAVWRPVSHTVLVREGLRRSRDRLASLADPVLLTAVLPLALLTILDLRRPLLSSRGLSVLAPCVVIVMCRGFATLTRTRQWVMGLLIAVLSVVGVVDGLTRPDRVRHYNALAQGIAARWATGDVIAIENEYRMPPLYFDLPWRRYRYLVPDSLPNASFTRVWIVGAGGETGERAEAYAKRGRWFGSSDIVDSVAVPGLYALVLRPTQTEADSLVPSRAPSR